MRTALLLVALVAWQTAPAQIQRRVVTIRHHQETPLWKEIADADDRGRPLFGEGSRRQVPPVFSMRAARFLTTPPPPAWHPRLNRYVERRIRPWLWLAGSGLLVIWTTLPLLRRQ